MASLNSPRFGTVPNGEEVRQIALLHDVSQGDDAAARRCVYYPIMGLDEHSLRLVVKLGRGCQNLKSRAYSDPAGDGTDGSRCKFSEKAGVRPLASPWKLYQCQEVSECEDGQEQLTTRSASRVVSLSVNTTLVRPSRMSGASGQVTTRVPRTTSTPRVWSRLSTAVCSSKGYRGRRRVRECSSVIVFSG